MAQTNVDIKVKIAGQEIIGDEVHDLVVEADLDQPDMAAVVLSNKSTKWSEKVNLGDDVLIEGGFATNAADAGTIFKGEVTGLEPTYQTKGGLRVGIRALNALH